MLVPVADSSAYHPGDPGPAIRLEGQVGCTNVRAFKRKSYRRPEAFKKCMNSPTVRETYLKTISTLVPHSGFNDIIHVSASCMNLFVSLRKT